MTQAKCSCGFSGDFTGHVQRDIEPGIFEVGIECPGCHKWFHSHYLNDKLIELQNKISKDTRRSYVLKYRREFKKLQVLLRGRFGVDAPKFKSGDGNDDEKI